MVKFIFDKKFFFQDNYKEGKPLIFYIGGTRTYKSIIEYT